MSNSKSKNGYVCFYHGRRLEVYAESLYQAQCKVIDGLKVPKSGIGRLSVTLAEKNGEQVEHTPTM